LRPLDEMDLESPVGHWKVRNDPAGMGHFGAPRGDRLHRGVDLLCEPMQPITVPFASVLERIARPYADDPTYSGALLRGEWLWAKLFYIIPQRELIGMSLTKGQQFAVAQDISEKYGEPMKPHIHFEITAVDPLCMFLQKNK